MLNRINLKFFKKWNLIVFYVSFVIVVSLYLLGRRYYSEYQVDARQDLKINIEKKFNQSFFEKKTWPLKLKVEEETYDVSYTFDSKLTSFVQRLLRRYQTDFSSVVVIDNNSGNVLAAVGRGGKESDLNYILPFLNTNPAASIFKIVSSASFMEKGGLKANTTFNYRGRGNTLYRYQLNNKTNRWTKYINFSKAFAHSNNVIFGKAAQKFSTPLGLFKTAKDFGFNRDLLQLPNIEHSRFSLPLNNYNLAEKASGFNNKTIMSTFHGAVLSSIIANNGQLKMPRIVQNIKNDKGIVWDNPLKEESIIKKKTALSIKKMMKRVVLEGTARRISRKLKRSLKKKLTIGGKTGSITGGRPFGKRDWFTSFVIPNNRKNDRGISICVMNVNVEKWYVKSTTLTKNIIEYYYKNKWSKKKKKIVLADQN